MTLYKPRPLTREHIAFALAILSAPLVTYGIILAPKADYQDGWLWIALGVVLAFYSLRISLKKLERGR